MVRKMSCRLSSMMTRVASRIYISVFVPVVEDPKHEQGYKICANDVLDRRELRNFHPDLQRYLDTHGLEDARVMTGVTKRQGGNRTVAQLKAEREQEYQQEVERPALYFGESSAGTSLLRYSHESGGNAYQLLFCTERQQ